MSEKTWADWCGHHGAIFGLNSPADLRMLAEWAGLFALEGWTPQQLLETTDWLALNMPPKFRNEHLEALQNRIRKPERVRPPQPVPDEGESICALCRGCGRVSVPNPKGDGLRADGWSIMAVACHCALGRWFVDHGGYMALRDYEMRNPGWKTRMEQHDELLRRQVRCKATASALDAALGAIQARRKAANARATPS